MQTPRSHRPLLAVLLALVFSASTALKMAHLWIDEHHHTEQHTCELDRNSTEQHFHDASYTSEDCDLCAFVLASPGVLPECRLPELLTLALLAPTEHPAYQSPALSFAGDASYRRGPPALA